MIFVSCLLLIYIGILFCDCDLQDIDYVVFLLFKVIFEFEVYLNKMYIFFIMYSGVLF